MTHEQRAPVSPRCRQAPSMQRGRLPAALLAVPLAALALVLCACPGGPAVALASGPVTLDFESGSLAGWNTERLAEPYSATVVRDVVRRGRFAVRFEVRQGDQPTRGFRAELMDPVPAPLGRDVWYGFSTLIPRDFPIQKNRCVISQWWANPDNRTEKKARRSPPLAQRYIDGKLYVTLRHSSEPTQRSNDGTKRTLFRTKQLKRGVWHDFVYRIRWSPGPDGRVVAWLDGEKIVDYTGPVGYRDAKGPSFKLGIYRDDVPQTYVTYCDEYRRGDSFAAVDPARGQKPPDEAEPQVVTVGTAAPGLSAAEVESAVTLPLSVALNGVSGIAQVRTVSLDNQAWIFCVLAPGADPRQARLSVVKRLGAVASQLPTDVDLPTLAPARASRRHAFPYVVTSPDADVVALTELQLHEVAPALATVPGVAEVQTFGGRRSRVEIGLDGARLSAFGLSHAQVVSAVQGAARAGGEARGKSFLVRGAAAFRSVEDIGAVALASRGGAVVRLRDVARIALGTSPPTGARVLDGREVVFGLVWPRPGADYLAVHRSLRLKLKKEQTRLRRTGGGKLALQPVAAGELDRALAAGGSLRAGAAPDRAGPKDEASGIAPTSRPFSLELQGDAAEPLLRAVAAVAARLRASPAVRGVRIFGAATRPTLSVQLDRKRLARFGLRPADVRAEIAAVRGPAQPIAFLARGKRRVPVVLAHAGKPAGPDRLRRLLLLGPGGVRVPLAAVAKLEVHAAPAMVLREGGRRLVAIYAWGEQAGFDRWFPQLKATVEREMKLPPKTRLVWNGQSARMKELLEGL